MIFALKSKKNDENSAHNTDPRFTIYSKVHKAELCMYELKVCLLFKNLSLGNLIRQLQIQFSS
jgi:hypothetical protein